MRHLDDLPNSYKPLLASLNRTYIIDKEYIDVNNTRIRKTVFDYINYLFNQPWALEMKYGSLNNEAITYFLNEPHYQGHLINYMNDQRNLFKDSNWFKIDAVMTYKEIAMLLAANDSIPESITLNNPKSSKESKVCWNL